MSISKELEQLQKRKVELQEEANRLDEKQRTLEERVRILEETIAIEQLQDQIEARQQSVKELESKIADLEQKLNELSSGPKTFVSEPQPQPAYAEVSSEAAVEEETFGEEEVTVSAFDEQPMEEEVAQFNEDFDRPRDKKKRKFF
ncbi:MAG: hypothetical protein QW840_03295 [Candidatus Bathyarchaeia archaeon]